MISFITKFTQMNQKKSMERSGILLICIWWIQWVKTKIWPKISFLQKGQNFTPLKVILLLIIAPHFHKDKLNMCILLIVFLFLWCLKLLILSSRLKFTGLVISNSQLSKIHIALECLYSNLFTSDLSIMLRRKAMMSN